MQRILLIGRGLILGFSLLLGVTRVQAQVPGYMGGRLLVQADLELAPTVVGPTIDNRYFFRNLALSKAYGFRLNYVLNRHRTIGAYFNTFNTGFEDVTNSNATNSAEGFYSLKCYTVGISGRRYTNIAPFGGYFEMGGEVSRLQPKLERYNYVYSEYDTRQNELVKDVLDLGINLGWGYSNIIHKHLIIDLGIQSHFSLLGAPFGFSYFFEDGTKKTDLGLTIASRVRKGYHSILMFKIGVGYLF